MEKTKMGNQLRELRKKANITQAELAVRLGVQQSAISHWERGDNLPETRNLLKMSEIFGCTVDELVKGPQNTAAAV